MRFSMIFSLVLFAAALGCGDGTQTTMSGSAGTSGSAGASTGGTGGSSTGGTGGSSAGGTGGSSTGGSMTGSGGSMTGSGGSMTGSGGSGACVPKTTDASKVGVDCAGSMMCPTGYECWAVNGITVSYHCAIICKQDCECPSGTTCKMHSDKATTWSECEGK